MSFSTADSDLRITIARVEKGAKSPPRAPRKVETTPRVAKIAFGIGVGLLGVVVLVPVASALMRSPSGDARGPNRIAPASSASPTRRAEPSSNATSLAPPASDPRGGDSGAAWSGRARVDAPMPPAALSVLTGLFSVLYDASHDPAGARSANDPAERLPRGCLEGASAEVLANLAQAQQRVAGQPALALRVVSEARSSFAFSYEYEVVSSTAAGDEVVARGRIDLVPVDEETMRVTKLDALTPFDATGGKVSAATFEQATAPREAAPVAAAPAVPGRVAAPGGALPAAAPMPTSEPGAVATYPYVIR